MNSNLQSNLYRAMAMPGSINEALAPLPMQSQIGQGAAKVLRAKGLRKLSMRAGASPGWTKIGVCRKMLVWPQRKIEVSGSVNGHNFLSQGENMAHFEPRAMLRGRIERPVGSVSRIGEGGWEVNSD